MGWLEVKAESELAGAVQAFQEHGGQIGNVLPTIAEMIVATVSDVFEAEGPGWEPLQESTIARRRGSTHKILQDTGLMANVAPMYGSTYAEAVSPAPYGKFHAPDPQGRDWTNLGPFESPLLDEVSEFLLHSVTA